MSIVTRAYLRATMLRASAAAFVDLWSHGALEQYARFQPVDGLVAALELPENHGDGVDESVRDVDALVRTVERIDDHTKRLPRRIGL